MSVKSSRGRRLRVEPLEDRRLLAIGLISAVSDPLLFGEAASGASQNTAFAVSHDGRYVAFQSSAADLVGGDTNRYRDVFVHDVQTRTVLRVSTDSAGAQANDDAEEPAISGDGRFVAFSSTADNLVPGDTNGKRDVFVKDLQTGLTIRVSTSGTGAQSDGKSYAPSLSSDGRYVAFASAATNLVAGDSNAFDDVFVKDLASGATTRASTTAAGAQADNASTNPDVSADGRYVAFVSLAANLSAGDINGAADIYRKDVLSGAVARVSTDTAGAGANGPSAHPSISGDGRYVAFSSDATNLVAGDNNLFRDVFLKDLADGITRRVSTSSAGAQATDGSGAPAISADGRYVAFHSGAEDLVLDDTNGDSDVFLKDLVSDATVRASTDGNGDEANGDSAEAALSADGRFLVFLSDARNLARGDVNGVSDVFLKDRLGGDTLRLTPRNASVLGTFAAGGLSDNPAVSADGRYVVFQSSAENLVDGDSNNDVDIFLKDRLAGTITRVSTESDGRQANDDSEDPAITPDGRYVVFSSKATDLAAGDTNGCDDVFRKDLLTGLVTLVSRPAGGGLANGDSKDPAISADGRYVAFTSEATNLVAADTNLSDDVFLADLLSGTVTRVSISTAGAQGSDDSGSPAISSDGRYVAFESDAINLVTGDTNNDTDVFLRDMSHGTTTRLSVDTGGGNGNGDSTHPSMSGDGRYVVFSSEATDLVAGDTNLCQDIFLCDRQTGLITRVSTNAGGAEANGDSGAPEISSDGRWVVFRSDAADLVSGDVNGQEDIFLKDLATGAVTRVSSPAGAFEADGDASSPAISGDGAYIVFASDAGNLAERDGNELTDVFGAANPAMNRQPTDLTLTGSLVLENFPAGTLVGTFATTDPDLENTFSYSFAAGTPDNGAFTILGNELRTAGPFDYELRSAYTIRARTTDQGGLWMEKDFTITIANVNEAPLQIAATGALAVAENSPPGTAVCSLATIDPDLVDSHTYFLVDNAGGRFAVQGAQILVAAGPIDYEAATGFVVRVRSTDSGGLSCETNVAIDVTDVNEAPTGIPVAEPITVLEHSPQGTLVCTLITADPDAGDTHVYTLVDNAGGRFALDATHVVVADGSLIDYATAATHTIRVRSTDRGGLWFERDLTIQVTSDNQAPTDILAPQPVAVAENSPAGTLVFTLATSDPDAGDFHTYTLVNDARGCFAVSGDRLLVADSRLLDYEAGTSHAVRVRSTDRGGLWCEREFTVGVADVHDFASPALFDPRLSNFSLRASNTTGPADYSFGFGAPGGGWQVLVGDWKGDGCSGVGLYDPDGSSFYLTSAYVSGFAEHTFGYGAPGAGWIPLVGDWDGDGRSGVGLYDPHTSSFFLTDTLQTGVAEHTFGYGAADAGWIPLVGDWNGDGRSGVGLYDPATSWFYLTNAFATGVAEITFGYGAPGAAWQPLVGDWNANGSDGVGLYDPHASMFYLTNAFVTGVAEYTFGYGAPEAGWKPLVGDFDGTAGPGVGLYDPAGSTFYLTNALQSGVAEYTVGFGAPAAGLQPIVGCWTQPALAPATALDPQAVDQLVLGHELGDPLCVDLVA